MGSITACLCLAIRHNCPKSTAITFLDEWLSLTQDLIDRIIIKLWLNNNTYVLKVYLNALNK